MHQHNISRTPLTGGKTNFENVNIGSVTFRQHSVVEPRYATVCDEWHDDKHVTLNRRQNENKSTTRYCCCCWCHHHTTHQIYINSQVWLFFLFHHVFVHWREASSLNRLRLFTPFPLSVYDVRVFVCRSVIRNVSAWGMPCLNCHTNFFCFIYSDFEQQQKKMKMYTMYHVTVTCLFRFERYPLLLS